MLRLRGRRVRRRGLAVLVVVAVIGLLRGVRTSLVAGEPAGAVIRLAAGLAATAGGDATAPLLDTESWVWNVREVNGNLRAEEEEEEEAD